MVSALHLLSVSQVRKCLVQAAARQDATLALMKELPALLRKVQTDPAQVRAAT